MGLVDIHHSRVAVIGSSFYLNRHKFLFDAIAQKVNALEVIESIQAHTLLDYLDQLTSRAIFFTEYLFHGSGKNIVEKFNRQKLSFFYHRSFYCFIPKSRQLERRILRLDSDPDWFFQLFNGESPFRKHSGIPYIYYLDITVALNRQFWRSWSTFSDRDFARLHQFEKHVFQQAVHLFPMSHLVRQSLIEDYDILPEKITVVGSSGNFKTPYTGEKTFGSKRLVFNGSDFHRKGGDIVLDAFKLVKKQIPEATLTLIGSTLDALEDGVENPGFLDAAQIEQMFLAADLLVAPARWDPFPGFVIEAMNYGVPCIVSANGGIPEIMDNQTNGIVLEQLTPEALAQQVIELLNDPARLQLLSNNARQKVADQLNWNAIADTILNKMSELI